MLMRLFLVVPISEVHKRSGYVIWQARAPPHRVKNFAQNASCCWIRGPSTSYTLSHKPNPRTVSPKHKQEMKCVLFASSVVGAVTVATQARVTHALKSMTLPCVPWAYFIHLDADIECTSHTWSQAYIRGLPSTVIATPDLGKSIQERSPSMKDKRN